MNIDPLFELRQLLSYLQLEAIKHYMLHSRVVITADGFKTEYAGMPEQLREMIIDVRAEISEHEARESELLRGVMDGRRT